MKKLRTRKQRRSYMMGGKKGSLANFQKAKAGGRIRPLPNGKGESQPGPSVRPKWVPYSEYLQSNWWKARRKQKLKNAGYQCNRCGSNKALQIHHLSYKRLGCEKEEDLEVLCRNCHEGEHIDAISVRNHLQAISEE